MHVSEHGSESVDMSLFRTSGTLLTAFDRVRSTRPSSPSFTVESMTPRMTRKRRTLLWRASALYKFVAQPLDAPPNWPELVPLGRNKIAIKLGHLRCMRKSDSEEIRR